MGKTAQSETGFKHPWEGKLLDDGLTGRDPVTGAPKEYGMDNLSDKKNQKPMSTPRKPVTGKGKDFTIC